MLLRLLLIGLLAASAEAHTKRKFLDLIHSIADSSPVRHPEYVGSNLVSAPREVLLDALVELRNEITAVKTQLLEASNCTICFSNPCQRGTCIPDNNSQYHCDCPDDYAGHDCETHVVCNVTSCGANAQCHVQNHQINCVCDLGFSGNPFTGCNLATVSACFQGDPHYTTFDGLTYDYMGSCPTIYSQPCTTLGGGYAHFSVKPQNFLADKSNAAVASSVQVEMYGQTITILQNGRIFVNKKNQGNIYNWPDQVTPKITITPGRVENDQHVAVTFAGGEVCLIVPNVTEFRGKDTLCGLAGNIDGDWKNDLRMRDGSLLTSPTSKVERNISDIFADDWLTADFWHSDSIDACVDGTMATNSSDIKCSSRDNAVADCQTIYMTLEKKGPLAPCSGMSEKEVMRWYDNCMFRVCQNEPGAKCNSLTEFVHTCQRQFPDVNLHNWRDDDLTKCPISCTPHATYLDCASSCPATCSDHIAPDHCSQRCTEGCSCDYGYVADDTQPNLKCIKIEQCGCADDNGNRHQADIPWYTFNCSVFNQCTNGTYHTQDNACSDVGHCTVTGGEEQCVCDIGYQGDGYICTDIDECLDAHSCSVDKGQGTCTNTQGSYSCSCNTYFEGHDCELYRPNRHCADLITYQGKNTSGVYQVLPPYDKTSMKYVYCDMDTAGGGWTVVSAADDIPDFFTNKPASSYESGFGPRMGNGVQVWLGLVALNGFTTEMASSLRLELQHCDQSWTDCTYPSFGVLTKSDGFAVNISEACKGSETVAHPTFPDGWARWDLSKPGPAFTSVDNDLYACSNLSKNVGWWFQQGRCGSANLNGARGGCGVPDDSYIEWMGGPIAQSRMLLRPAAFPDYDLKDWL